MWVPADPELINNFLSGVVSDVMSWGLGSCFLFIRSKLGGYIMSDSIGLHALDNVWSDQFLLSCSIYTTNSKSRSFLVYSFGHCGLTMLHLLSLTE